LLWLAARALRSHAALAGPAVDLPPVQGRELLRRGFLLQIANPKALLFFAAILPPFVDLHSPPAWPPWLQVLVLGVTSVGSEFWVLLGYGCLAGAAAARVRSPTFVHWLDRVSGLLLLAVAVWVALR
ncbi:MAG TPA: LysE family translocator, partial [Planctomycetota bacterium]|nr:LysE family translocator [Planctomycetota bacterium]